MIPDFFDALTGYRVWYAHPNGLLVGQAHAYPWPPYEAMVSRCGYASSPAHLQDGEFVEGPLADCDCGLYALKTYEEAEKRAETTEAPYNYLRMAFSAAAPYIVWGEIKLWGRVFEHEAGYRSQFAYPSKLYTNRPTFAPILERVYGVPCEVKELKEEEGWGCAVGIFQRGSYPFWRTQPVAPKALLPTQAKTLHQPSLAQLRTLQSTPWQKAQAQMQARQNPFAQSWQELWRNGFKVKPITFKNIPISGAVVAKAWSAIVGNQP